MIFSHFEAVNKVVRRELLRELWNALWGKQTMFLPSPKSGGFVLDNAMTTCAKATASPWFCAGWSLHAHFALSIKQNLSLRDSKYNAEIVHVFFVLSFLKFHAHSQICTSSLRQLLFFTTPHVHTDGSCRLCYRLLTWTLQQCTDSRKMRTRWKASANHDCSRRHS